MGRTARIADTAPRGAGQRGEGQLFEEAKGLFAGRQDHHEQLLAQWSSAQPDAKQIHAIIDQRADELRAFAHSAADAALKVHGVLTPEQRAQLTKDLADHRAH